MNLQARFKPRAESSILRQLLQDGWQTRYAQNVESKRDEVGAAIADHLESLFPLADMEILRRYDCVRDLTEAHVSVYNPETQRWDQSFGIKMPRAIAIPTRSYYILLQPTF